MKVLVRGKGETKRMLRTRIIEHDKSVVKRRFFFFNENDARRRWREGASPKGLDWPLDREKKKKRGILWAG